MLAVVFIVFTLPFFPVIRPVAAGALGKSVCQDMWNKAENNLVVGMDLKVDKTSPQGLFQLLENGKTKTKKNEFVTFAALLESYSPDSKDGKLEREMKVEAFLKEMAQPGGPLEQAFKYLQGKVLLPTTKMEDFLKLLRDTWFQEYEVREGQLLSGFEHVFLGDIYKEPKTSQEHYEGFHNWYSFLLEQEKKKITQVNVKSGNIKRETEPPFIASLQFEWNGLTKVQPNNPGKRGSSSMFVGTSPGFEFALFSICFLQFKGELSSCNIGKSSITILALDPSVHGLLMHSQKVLTAYPRKVAIDNLRCNVDQKARTDCGWLGIDEPGCQARGCCNDNTNPPHPAKWCFYPKEHKCDVSDPKSRVHCGYLGIKREECEKTLSCCFDESVPEAPLCFKGNP